MRNILDTGLISTKYAAQISGYSQDYLGRLCKSGKIRAQQTGRVWLIDEASLRSFVENQAQIKSESAQRLSEQREQEYKNAQISDQIQSRQDQGASTPYTPTPSPFTFTSRRVALAVALCSVVLCAYGSTSAAFNTAFEASTTRIISLARAYTPTYQPVAYMAVQPEYVNLQPHNLPQGTLRPESLSPKTLTANVSYALSALRHTSGNKNESQQFVPVSTYSYTGISNDPLDDIVDFDHMIRAYVGFGYQVLEGISSVETAFAQAGGLSKDATTHSLATLAGYSDDAINTYVAGIYGWTSGSQKVADTIVDSHMAFGNEILAQAGNIIDTVRTVSVALGEQRSTDLLGAVEATTYGEDTSVFTQLRDKFATFVRLIAAYFTRPTLPGIATSTPVKTLALGETTVLTPPSQATSLETVATAVLIRGGSDGPIYNTYNNYYYPQTVGNTTNTAVLDARFASVRESISKSVDAALRSVYRSGSPAAVSTSATTAASASSVDGGTITNSAISGGTISSSTITGGSVSPNTLAVSGNGSVGGDLVIGGNLTAGTLTVTGLTTGAALFAPYFVATSTTATTSLTNVIASTSVVTQATSTTLFSSVIGAVTGNITNLTTSVANIATAAITNLAATNAVLTNATTTNATSTNLAVTNFSLGGSTFTSFTGTGLQNVGGVLRVATTTLGNTFFAQGGNAFGGGAQIGTTDAQPLSLITNGTPGATLLSNGNFGIGTTSPNAKLTVNGTALISGATTLGSLITTGTASVNALSVGTLSGFLKATAGTVSTSLIDLSTDVTSTLAAANGGTGFGTYTPGDLLYANGSGVLSKLAVGGAGKVLKVIGGVPAWGDDLAGVGGGGGSDGVFATSTNLIYPLNPGSTLVLGNTATATTNSIFEVQGNAYFSGRVGIGSTTPGFALSVEGSSSLGQRAIAGYFTATSSTASFFPNASTTNLTVLGTNGLTLGSLTGALIANNGVVSATSTIGVALGGTGATSLTGLIKGNGTSAFTAATPGTDYQSPITLTTTGTSGAATFLSNTLNIPQYQAAGNYITALTGDATASGPGSAALTLATVNSNVGTFNNVTVNGKGLVTSASNVSYLTGNQSITLSGDVSGTGTTAITTAIGAGKVTNTMLAGSIAASKLIGTDITTVGTIASGTWQGSVIGQAYGGAGTVNGLLKANGSGTVSAATPGTDYLAPTSLSAGSGISYSSGTGVIGNTGVLSFNGRTGAVTPQSGDYTTSLVAEGSRLYYTDARVDARINATSTIASLTSAPNLGTLATSLTGILRATSGVLSTSLVNLASDITGVLAVANGGTGASSQATNGVNYFDGTKITSAAGFVFDGANVGIGTTSPDAPLTISNAGTAFLPPLAGTMLHVVSSGAPNGRIVLDVYNNTTSAGANFKGRRARGSAAAPSTPLADDILSLLSADGYGSTGFHSAAVGAITIRAENTFTDTSAPTYISLLTSPTGTTTPVERFRIASNGNVGIASSTPGSLFSIGGVAAFTTGTTTFLGSGGINLTSGCYAVGGVCITGGAGSGISSIGPTGQLQSGPTITQATTSDSTTGLISALTIVGSGNTLTYSPKLSGILSIANGGTNASSQSTNGVAFFDGTSLSTGSGLVFSGGNLGIGSSSPSVKLSVTGSGYFSGDVTAAGNIVTNGTYLQTSSSATAFTVGPNGTTNPVFQIDASAASSANGLSIKSSALANGVNLSVISVASNDDLNILPKGNGSVTIGTSLNSILTGSNTFSVRVNNSTRINLGIGTANFTQNVLSTAASVRYSFTGAADTALTASTEAPSTYFNLSQTRTHATGAITTQRDYRISGSIHAYNSGTAANNTIASSTVFAIDGPSVPGALANITNSYAAYINGTTTALNSSTTNSYGLAVVGSTGAVNNYAATFLNGNVGVGTSTPTAQFTNTGTVRFASLGSASANLITDALGNVTVSSDERLKDINGKFTRGLADISKLSPILYHWNAISGLDQGNQYTGFSAQNVQAAIPEAVGTDARGYLTLADRPILAAAVNAIQELAGQTSQLSLATSSLARRVSLVESQTPAPAVIPSSLSVSSITATTFLAPASPYSIGSTSAVFADDVFASNGTIDLVKAASYAVVQTQLLASRTDLLATRIDDLATRVAALESPSSSTASSTSLLAGAADATSFITDTLARLGIKISAGLAEFASIATNQITVKRAEDGVSAAGSATVLGGQTSVTIANRIATPQSKIFITLTSPSTGTWYVTNKTSGAFNVTFSTPQQGDTTFDYLIIGTDGDSSQSTASGGTTTATSTPEVAPDTSSTATSTLETEIPANITITDISSSSTLDEPPAAAPVVPETPPAPAL